MEYRESALFFDCDGDSLLGVLANPCEPRRTGVVVVVGGPQYRVGSHRQFVTLSRTLATAGIPCLRFDYRGMGDSEGKPRTFEMIDRDIAAGVDVLARETGVTRIVLWGLCDGASAAMMYASGDKRIAGIVAVNPWVRTDATQASARMRHYYLRRVASRAFWRKLVRGNVRLRDSVQDLASDALRIASRRSDTDKPFLVRMNEAWNAFERPVLFVLSGNDMTAREFESWMAADPARQHLPRRKCAIRVVPDADHTFSRREYARQVEALTAEWVISLSSP